MNNEELLQYVAKEIRSRCDVDINYTIKGKDYLVKYITPSYLRKFNMPGVMVIPQENCSNRLVLESNNLETNDLNELLRNASQTAYKLIELTKSKPAPILIPVLSSEKELPYFQQLSRGCFELSKNDRNYRIDEQVVRMIEQAKKFVKRENGIELDDKIFLSGYSTSGVFAQRLAMLHPELIDTACIGGASGSIPFPSKGIGYPIGIQDYEYLFGKSFDMDSYSKIKFRYYVGELETTTKAPDRMDEEGAPAPMHDMSYFDRSVPTEVGIKQRTALGQDLFLRADRSVKL